MYVLLAMGNDFKKHILFLLDVEGWVWYKPEGRRSSWSHREHIPRAPSWPSKVWVSSIGLNLADTNFRSGDAKVFIVSAQWTVHLIESFWQMLAGSQYKPKYRNRRPHRRSIHSNCGTRVHRFYVSINNLPLKCDYLFYLKRDRYVASKFSWSLL